MAKKPSYKEALLLRAIQWIGSTNLPRAADVSVVAGRSTGRRCALCGDSITPGAVEYELTGDSNRIQKVHRLHSACYPIWQKACQLQPAPTRQRQMATIAGKAAIDPSSPVTRRTNRTPGDVAREREKFLLMNPSLDEPASPSPAGSDSLSKAGKKGDAGSSGSSV
jgi:hypothetical protein